MKFLKTYETINKQPEIGDYVICEDTYEANFTLNNIGKIIDNVQSSYPYIVYYDTSSCPFTSNTRRMSLSEIKYWSPNKEDLGIYLDQNKYNL